MKTAVVLATVLSLLELATAQPHGARRFKHRHAKRDYVTEIDYVTESVPDVIVYVDEDGTPFSTSFVNKASPTPSPPAPYSSAPVSVVAPEPTSAYQAPPAPVESEAPPSPYTPAPAPTSSAAPAPPAPVSSAAPAPSSPASEPSSGMGITYSPYNADGTCKTQDQVSGDIAKLTGYGMVRIYGTDCNQVTTVLKAANANNKKLFVGIYDIGKVTDEINTIISAAKGSWSTIDTVAVGNELVNSGQASVSAVVGAIGTARGLLKAAGYTGSVVTVDTFVAIIARPELCTASDYCAANCHAFFDGNVEASGAGDFVAAQAKRVSDAAGGKKVVITESGWPSQGGNNNKAVPSSSNQAAAVSSLKAAFSSNPSGLIMFTAFNDLWKKDNAGTFGCEKFWGILG